MDNTPRAQNFLKRRQDEKKKIESGRLRDRTLQDVVDYMHDSRMKNGGRLPYGMMDDTMHVLSEYGIKISRSALNRRKPRPQEMTTVSQTSIGKTIMDDPTRAQNVLKRGQAEKRSNTCTFANRIREKTLQITVNELDNAKMENGGRLPYGKMDEILQVLEKAGIIVSRDLLINRLKRKPAVPSTAENEEPRPPPLGTIDINSDDQSIVSSLNGVRGVEDPDENEKTKGGRPIGTTEENKRKEQLNMEGCKNDITKTYQAELDELSGNKRMPKGYLRELIEEKKKEYNYPQDFYISPDTIRSRLKRKRF